MQRSIGDEEILMGISHSSVRPPLDSACEPLLKSMDTTSLLSIAKALLSLQRTIQGRPVLRQDTNYLALRDTFLKAITGTLRDDNEGEIPDSTLDREEQDLIELGFRRDKKQQWFT